MDLFHPMRSYRRYRRDNQYDAPLLIFLIDNCISIFKILGLLFALALAWLTATAINKNYSSNSGALATTVARADNLQAATSKYRH